MGRAGLEPATLGLKVLHIARKPNLKKRRFEPLNKPFGVASASFSRIVLSPAWCVHGALSATLDFPCMKRQRRLRKLVPDAELIRRRAADEPLRELASDYNVAHTTLGRFFERPDVARQLRQARQELRAGERALATRRSAERRLEQDIRRRAKEQAAAELEQPQAAARMTERARRRRLRSDYEAWLDERDARVPWTRADLHSGHDQTAARVVAEGGGIQAIIEATDLRSLDNVVRLIDPEILSQAYDNDAIAKTQPSGERGS